MARPAVIIAALTILCSAIAAPTSAPGSHQRTDDLVVLDGDSLRFDPLYNIGDAKKDPEWQLEYMESLLTFETDQGLAERSELLEKRVGNGALCFECMVGTLKLITSDIGTRTFAKGVCTPWCASLALSTIIARASDYAAELGWDWGNGPQTENKYTWQHAARV